MPSSTTCSSLLRLAGATLRPIRRVLVVLIGLAPATWPLSPGLSRPQEVIEVYPAPHALANALMTAKPGDTLNIHAGRYPGAVVVTTAGVTLRSAGDGIATIDGLCRHETTLEVRAPSVVISALRIVGADGPAAMAVNFRDVRTGMITDSVVDDSCGQAEYGINVLGSEAVRVIGNHVSGFDGSGIYVGHLARALGGGTEVRGNLVTTSGHRDLH